MTRLLTLLALVLFQAPAPSPTSSWSSLFRYRRPITAPAPGQVCAVLDAATFSHAAPFLKDLRLYTRDAHELPFVITLSEAQQAESEPARILNLGSRGPTITFDLAMPARLYTEVDLDLAAHDFLATAVVTGIPAPGSPQATSLGDFNLFDLTSQHLARSTSLHLQESSFPFLHVVLTTSPAAGHAFTPTPALVRGATVPPSREAQTLFTVAAQTSTLQQRGKDTVAHFTLPARVPIERVSFTLDPAFHANFSRDVLVTTHEPADPDTPGDSLHGAIERVHLTEGSREIRDQQLTVPATLGANLQHPAEVDVAVQNGDDPPLTIASVALEMRQSSLCFKQPAGQPVTLFYGDPDLPAPVYDLSRTYIPSLHATVASLGPEQPNPAWRPLPDRRPYTERHPHLLWVALLIVVCTLALVAFRSSRKHRHHPHHPG